jgi:hypothetical protein
VANWTGIFSSYTGKILLLWWKATVNYRLGTQFAHRRCFTLPVGKYF